MHNSGLQIQVQKHRNMSVPVPVTAIYDCTQIP
jgi:hypothetical protein